MSPIIFHRLESLDTKATCFCQTYSGPRHTFPGSLTAPIICAVDMKQVWNLEEAMFKFRTIFDVNMVRDRLFKKFAIDVSQKLKPFPSKMPFPSPSPDFIQYWMKLCILESTTGPTTSLVSSSTPPLTPTPFTPKTSDSDINHRITVSTPMTSSSSFSSTSTSSPITETSILSPTHILVLIIITAVVLSLLLLVTFAYLIKFLCSSQPSDPETSLPQPTNETEKRSATQGQPTSPSNERDYHKYSDPAIQEVELLYEQLKNLNQPLPDAGGHSGIMISQPNQLSDEQSVCACRDIGDIPLPPAPVQCHSLLEDIRGLELPTTPRTKQLKWSNKDTPTPPPKIPHEVEVDNSTKDCSE